jgi:ABC-type transporter Mla MlaB component
MALRITTNRCRGVTVVRIDGQLHKQGVAELAKVCQSLSGALCLDLANLQSIDANGVQLIFELEARGVAVVGVTPYIDTLLKRLPRT